jgi:hypothetical protein
MSFSEAGSHQQQDGDIELLAHKYHRLKRLLQVRLFESLRKAVRTSSLSIVSEA